MPISKLEKLKKLSTVVADTGDVAAIKKYEPVDATTNPSLILAAAQLPEYRQLLERSLDWARASSKTEHDILALSIEKLSVEIGSEILKMIPGRISTEVDARLSFDTQATIKKAYQIVDMYDQNGVSSNRLLIKIPSTWEGIRAAEILEREGIKCNLTLLFSFAQAVACADAGVHLISPFVGRILDWYKAKKGIDSYPIDEDPGVQSVSKIFNYYKVQGYKTIVMGASFRSAEQVERLAGCDYLTISPALLEQLQTDVGDLKAMLDAKSGVDTSPKVHFDEKAFRWSLNEDAMATEKLAEGVRTFALDQTRLEDYLRTTIL